MICEVAQLLQEHTIVLCFPCELHLSHAHSQPSICHLIAMLRVVRSVLRRSLPSIACQHIRGMAGCVVVATGPDRLGILSDASKAVKESGSNVGKSDSIKILDTFTIAMEVQGDEIMLADLSSRVEAALPGFMVSVQEGGAGAMPNQTARFHVSLADRPGIMSEVTAVFAKHGLSVISASTSNEIAPFGGTTLFAMEGILAASSTAAFGDSALEGALRELEASTGILVSLTSDA